MSYMKTNDLPSVTNIRGFETKEIVQHDNATIKIIILNANDQIPNHQVPVDVTFFVLEGYGKIMIGDQIYSVSKDDALLCPPNTMMNVTAGIDGLRFLNIKTPGFIVKK